MPERIRAAGRRGTLLSAILAGLALAPLPSGSAQSRPLTFEERLRAQEAIERVYYSHQIGATRPFEEAVPLALLERKVRTYLKQSVALEKVWKTPVTEAALQRELERIAASTRFPERLEQIYDALNRDRSLLLECFARPVLVDRLSRDFFAFDQRIHGAAREGAEDLRQRLARGILDIQAALANRHVLKVTRGGRSMAVDERVPTTAATHFDDAAGGPLELSPEEFERWRARAPRKIGDVGPVVEEREAFVVRVLLDETSDGIGLAVYTVPKTGWDAWWAAVAEEFDETAVNPVAAFPGQRPVATAGNSGTGPTASACVPDDTWDNGILDDLPLPRFSHTAVWTGSLVIVWGGVGFDGNPLNTGARYDPLTDSWAATTTSDAPAARGAHTAVWTGTEMIVWSGFEVGNSFLTTGGRYDHVTDSWKPTSTLGVPTGRLGHTAVWTGSEMIVWGGRRNNTVFDSGGRYNPATETWSATSTAGAPSARWVHTAVWTGSQMIIWGGGDATNNGLGTGGRYDPASNTWTPTSTTAAPERRAVHTAVWTGSRMIVWGGERVFAEDLNTGGQYDPASDTWAPTTTTGAPSYRNSHTAVWTGSEMIVWGGKESRIDFELTLQTGGRYDPAADSWVPTSVPAPAPRANHTAVWTGSQMVVWGGHYDVGMGNVEAVFNSGGRYDPASDTWTPTSLLNTPSGMRCCHSAIWTGNVMIVWGGRGEIDFPVNSGRRYDLLTDAWTSTSRTSAPTARSSHQAVWTGTEMIIWGGGRSDGGRYDPVSDTWRPTSTVGAPSPRFLRTPAIWTGREMIVWGGLVTTTTATDTGGRYDPATDRWSPTSTTGAPSPRNEHTAVWTGSEMIVWGGSTPLVGVHNTGARYDPSTDSWKPVSLSSAPSSRQLHSAIWTGKLMIIWGGIPSFLNTGGRYDPVTESWTATSTANAPAGRYFHTAVWTGNKMIVWGGSTSTGEGNTGGLYDPAADVWTPTSTTNAPPRYGGGFHTAVWTGGFMIVWGRNWGGRYALEQAVDNDADGFSDCAGDCDDMNPSVWGRPLEVSSLDLLPGTPTSLAWTSQTSLVGPGTLYDLASGALLLSGGLDFGSAICMQSSTATSHSDGRPDPETGSGFWYLVRARNSCGAGTYGTPMRDGSILACP